MAKQINSVFMLGFIILLIANINSMVIEYPTMVGRLIFPYLMGFSVCFVGILLELTQFNLSFSPLKPNENFLVMSGGIFSSVVYFVSL